MGVAFCHGWSGTVHRPKSGKRLSETLCLAIITRRVIGFCKRYHNPLRQRGIGPSLTCRVAMRVA